MPAIPCSDFPASSFRLCGRGAHLVIPALVAPSVAFVLVANRIFWRLKMLGWLGFDDALTILAMVSRESGQTVEPSLMTLQIFLVVQCASSIAAVDHGYGRPSDTLSKDQAYQALKVKYPSRIGRSIC